MLDPPQAYVARRTVHQDRLANARSRAGTISTARLGVALVELVILGAAWADWISPGWLLPPALLFVGLVVAHERVLRGVSRAERAVAYHDAGLRRLEGRWQGTGARGTDYVPPDHPYARDLDLFGRGSLFELLCTTRTKVGEHTLAGWLGAPAPLPTVRARQAAVEELRNNLTLREDLALAGEDMQGEIDPDELIGWGEAPPLLDDRRSKQFGALAWTLPSINVVAALAWGIGAMGAGPFVGALLLTWFVHTRCEPFVRQVESKVQRTKRELAVMACVMRRLESESFSTPMLQRLREELVSGESSASREIARLARLVEWFEVRQGQLIAFFAGGLLWGAHFSLAIERWRARHGTRIGEWFSALGELESLCALSAYAYERPDDVLPEVIEGGPLVDGDGLGHPLLPAARCVRNDIRLDSELQALVVSGSNMSGKSTYLRTVGLNVVLALAGAPVRARRLRVSMLHVGASLQIVDSLQDGASRFYAEITRLRQIAAMSRSGLLFLLDEILHGTNSHDRRIGAFAVLRSLVEAGAIGLVTTHDLALAADTESLGSRVGNVHFSDDVRDGELHFDYALRPGVVQSSNALELMRSVGLPV